MMHARDCTRFFDEMPEAAGAAVGRGASQKDIYMDHNGSVPMPDEVRDAMIPYLSRAQGNPSAGHWAAAPASRAISKARGDVAKLIGANPDQVAFTGGAGDANHLAVHGIADGEDAHIVASAIEHPSLLRPLAHLRAQGVRVTLVPVGRDGIVDVERLKDAVRPRTTLVSVMHANHQVGTIQPIRDIAEIAHKHGALMHCDVAQSAGRIRVNVDELGVDLLSVSSHKLGGPKGIGALYQRNRNRAHSTQGRGGLAIGRRIGTESALLAAGFGAAARIARHKDNSYVRLLRDYFANQLACIFGNRVVVNGHLLQRLPNTLNISFPGHVGADILMKMPTVAAAMGSTGHAASPEAPEVLTAMGLSADVARGSIRFSLGDGNTCEEIDRVLTYLRNILG